MPALFRIVFLTFAILSGCSEADMDSYAKDQVDITEVKPADGGGYALTFDVLTESAHFTPGLAVRTEGDRTIIRVVRCGLGETCPVTHAVDPAAPPPYTVVIPEADGELFLEDDRGLYPIGP